MSKSFLRRLSYIPHREDGTVLAYVDPGIALAAAQSPLKTFYLRLVLF